MKGRVWGRKFTNFETVPNTMLGELQIKCLGKIVQITTAAEFIWGGLDVPVVQGKSIIELISGTKPTSSSQTKQGQ